MIMDYGFWILDSIDPRRVLFHWKMRGKIRWDVIWENEIGKLNDSKTDHLEGG
jgi:hypothetical protein